MNPHQYDRIEAMMYAMKGAFDKAMKEEREKIKIVYVPENKSMIKESVGELIEFEEL